MKPVLVFKIVPHLLWFFFHFKTWMSAPVQRFQIFVIPIQPVPLQVAGMSVPVQHQKLAAMLIQITAVMVSIF